MILYEDPLRIEWEGTKLLIGGTLQTPNIRRAKDMYDVLADRYCLPQPDQELYYMYRGVYTNGTLRYDITIIPAMKYGKEYAKTYGHYHPQDSAGVGYPEIYHVLKGQATFILQKKNPDETVSVQVIQAKAGDVVLIPAGFGHASVNTSGEALVLGNVVSSSFESEYAEYKKSRGAAVYYTEAGVVQNTSYLIRNIEYPSGQEINRKYGFICQDLLKEFYANPKKFEFLEKPELVFRK